MEKIINALVLSPEQKEAFLAAAPGVEQVFLRDSDCLLYTSDAADE